MTSQLPAPATCQWTEDASGDYWDTECLEAFVLTDGTPADNHLKFCCYCGKPLVWRTAVDVAGDDED